MEPMTDTQVLDEITRYLRREEWNDAFDFLEDLARMVTATGRDIVHGMDDEGVIH